MYKKAAKKKLRFESEKGMVSVEDLWDLPLQALNKMAKAVNREIKANEEEDFLDRRDKTMTEAKLKLDILVDVIETRLADQSAKEGRAAKKAEREKLLGILEEKQFESKRALSIDDLKKEIAELEEEDNE